VHSNNVWRFVNDTLVEYSPTNRASCGVRGNCGKSATHAKRAGECRLDAGRSKAIPPSSGAFLLAVSTRHHGVKVLDANYQPVITIKAGLDDPDWL